MARPRKNQVAKLRLKPPSNGSGFRRCLGAMMRLINQIARDTKNTSSADFWIKPSKNIAGA